MCTLALVPDQPWGLTPPDGLIEFDEVATTVCVSFLGGEELFLSAEPGETVADLKRKVIALRGKPRGYNFCLLADGRQLQDSELATLLAAAAPLTAVYSASELSYRTMSADKSEVWLVGPYDPFFTEVYARMRANVAPETWVPSPPSHPTCCNLAKLSLGATVTASCGTWGSRLEAEERLNNLLRLGAMHGDPRFAVGMDFFEFKSSKELNSLTIDLGQPAVLARVGFMLSPGGLQCGVTVDIRPDPEASLWLRMGSVEYRSGGDDHRHAFLDFQPQRVSQIRFECGRSSPRFGPVFAYGWEERDAAAGAPHEAVETSPASADDMSVDG